MPDGIFLRDDSSKVIFQPIVSPREEDIYKIATRIVRRIRCLLEKRELLRPQNNTNEDLNTMDILAKQLPFSESGFVDRPRYKARLSAFIEGFSLQAGTHVHQNDRLGLEHLCRYGSRPPIAISRLKRLDDGNYEYSLKYPLPSGSYKLVLSGQQLMARLALLVPRPKIHLVKYYGV